MAPTAPTFTTSDWIACPECDLIQREPAHLRRHTLACARCNATLYHSAPNALDTTLAAMVAAAVLFAMANAFPLMSLELQGQAISATLFGMIHALHDAGMTSVALLVLFTLVLMPALEIGAFIYLLGPLKLGRIAPGFGRVARLLNTAQPWSMVEVFLLGVLVSIGKLEDFADLTLEAGFWCIGAVMLLMAVAHTIFDQRDLWDGAAAQARRASRSA